MWLAITEPRALRSWTTNRCVRHGWFILLLIPPLQAVIFDLDGVLIDSEHLWDQARRHVAARAGGQWTADATARMQGMSSTEWSSYMQHTLGVQLNQQEVIDQVVEQLSQEYAHSLPLLPGAVQAVSTLAERWPLGLASSSNRVIIDRVLEISGMQAFFKVTVSSEEVARGKPAPDVYLEAANKLGVPAARCAAIEDSANGLRSALAAHMIVVAVPNRAFPPPDDVLNQASLVLEDLSGLTAARLEVLA